MKKLYPSLIIISFILIFFGNNLVAQLQAGANNSTATTTNTSPVTIASVTIDPSSDAMDAVMLVGNVQMEVVNGSVVSQDCYLQFVDNTSLESPIITRHVEIGESQTFYERGLAGLCYIFEYSARTASTTFDLEISRNSPGNSKDVTGYGNMVAIVIDDSDDALAYDVENTTLETDINTSDNSGSLNTYYNILSTTAFTTTSDAAIYLSMALSTKSLSGTSTTGEWIIYKEYNNGTAVEIPESHVTRTNDADYGAVTMTLMLENQPAGSYEFHVKHKASGTEHIATRNLSLIAVGLADGTDVYPSFGSFGGSDDNSTASFEEVSNSGTVVAQNSTSVFAHTTFSMSSTVEIDAPGFKMGFTNGTFTPVTFYRHLSAGGSGSGGLVGLATGLSERGTTVVSLNHQSVGTSTLTTSNVNIVGFQLSPSNFKTNTGTGDWDLTTTWSDNQVPTSTDDVYISQGTVTIPSDVGADCRDLVVNSDLVVTSDATGSGTLKVAGSAQGDITYERYMTGSSTTPFPWHLISAPVVEPSINGVLTNTNNAIASRGSDPVEYAMSDYNVGTNRWNGFFNENTTGNFVSGLGYQVLITSNGTISFTGPVETADVSKGLTFSGLSWNCVGNPYPAGIFLNEEADGDNNFLETNSSSLDSEFVAIYYWDADNAEYVVVNNVVTGSNEYYIPPGQSFFVKAASATNVSITEGMQTHTSSEFKSKKEPWPNITLFAEKEGYRSNTIVAFNPYMTRGLDISYDAGMLKSNTSFSLYTKLIDGSSTDFAIQSLPDDYENLVIPVGLDARAGDLVTFTAEAVNLKGKGSCYLEDQFTGEITRLDVPNSSYTVELSEAQLGTGNFFIHTKKPKKKAGEELEIENPLNSDLQIIVNQPAGYVTIDGYVETGSIANVYDMNGRLLKQEILKKSNYNEITLSSLNRGMYILQINNEKRRKVEKIVW